MGWHWWEAMRAPEVAALPDGTVAVLPLAAVEQHGPHLPTGTDALIADGLLAAAAARCPEDLSVVCLPVQRVGKSNEHLWAAGTLSLSAQTVLSAWVEIGLSVAAAGIGRLILINSHGGNLDPMGIVARELRIRGPMLAVRANWVSLGMPAGVFSDRELRFGIHGGDYETSLMLHFRPDLVDMAAARDFTSSAEVTPLPPTGPVGYGWIARDVNPAGVAGEAHLATAAKGAAAAAHQAAAFVALAGTVAGMAVPAP